MNKRLGFAFLAGVLICPLTPASAGTFTSLFAFGDSLSDAGNLTILQSNIPSIPIPPSPPYAYGHFSNGPTWVEDLAKKLGLPTLTASLGGGDDYAYGGAQTGATTINPATNPVPIDLPAQISQYESTHSAPVVGALYTLDIGANDILNGLGQLSKGTISSADFVTGIGQAINNTVGAVTELYKDGMRSLLIYDVPQLGLTPEFNTDAKAAQAADYWAKTFNAAVLADITSLPSLNGLKLFNLDTYDLLGDVVDNKGADGITFSNVTDACVTSAACVGGSTADQNQYLFWDSVHPTEAGHQITADFAFAAIPEPSTWAMLLLGFVGLGYASSSLARKHRHAVSSAQRNPG